MDKISKCNSGFIKRKTFQITRNYFTDEQKHLIIEDFLSSGLTKREIWYKYTGQVEEHGQLLCWMRKLGYEVSAQEIKTKLAAKIYQVKKKETDKEPTDSFETLQLKKELKS